ncbi:MAG: hypothetical protein RSC29_01815, partial [Oscillospiraceae bacterium]
NAKTNLAENWLGTVGDVFLRSESQSAYATQMNDNGQYVRFTGKANLDNAKYRFVLGKNPYTEIENKSNVFDPATNVITECEIRFPNKENFGVSADVPVILFSVPTLATNPQIGADSKFIYFRIKSENGKYVLYTGEYGRNTPLTKLYEYTENELFGRWIKIKIDVDMQRGISTLSFDDGLYTKTCDMNKSDWQESTYWNNENFVRFLDFALIANNVNDFILDIKNVSMKRQVKIP